MEGSSKGRRNFPKGAVVFLTGSLTTLLAFQTPADAAVVPRVVALKPVRIRVRILDAVPKLTLGGYDLRIFGAAPGAASKALANRKLAAQTSGRSEWELHCQDGRIRAVSIGSRKELNLSEPVTAESLGGFIHVSGHPYRDSVSVHSEGSFCEVVNETSLEDYLTGLVNAEFSSHWSEQAIAAQVIAARSYALHQIKKAEIDRDQDYDVDSTVVDQVYDGPSREDYRAARIVAKTRGLVLVPKNSKEPLKAYYHSTCGGMTELPENVWGKPAPGFRHVVRCPYCVSSPRFRWALDIDSHELAGVIGHGARIHTPQGWPKKWSSLLKAGTLTDLRVRGIDPEGHDMEIVTIWEAKGIRLAELPVSTNLFREWLGPTRIRSTSFQIFARRGERGMGWHFDGRGNGHAVGMCQWGAKVMGEKGFTTNQILKFYYPDAVLAKLW